MEQQLQENQQENQVFQSDHLKATVQRRPGCMVHLEVEVDATATKSAYEKAVKAVKKEVSIPGFRKGKVPDDVVKHNFSSHIDREFRDTVVQTAFREALTCTKLKPFGSQSVKRSELKKCSKEEGALVIFDLETEPEIPTIDVAAITTRKTAPREVTEKNVNRAYKQLRVMHATWKEAEERPVAMGDFVEVDIDVTEHPAHNVCTNQLLLVEDEELPKWLLDGLIGMMPHESKEVTAQARPEDPAHIFVYENDQTPKTCRVTVKQIKNADLPAEDEEFAKKVGVDSLDVLKEKLAERLHTEEAQYASELSRYNLRRELLQKYPVELPQTLLETEIRQRMAYCKQSGDRSQGSLPTDQSKDDMLRSQVDAEARGFFSWMYLLRQITPQANVGVSQQDLEQEFQHQMSLPRLHRLVYPSLTPEEVRNRLFMLVLMRKCEEYLLDKVTA